MPTQLRVKSSYDGLRAALPLRILEDPHDLHVHSLAHVALGHRKIDRLMWCSSPVHSATDPRQVRVVLIHHGNAERVGPARSTAALVAEALGPLGPVTLDEVWHQPPLGVLPWPELAARRVRQWKLERRWARRLGVGPRWLLSLGLLAVRLLQLLLPEARQRYGRQAFIELALTSKHVLAWRQAYEASADVLVVLEDDARAHPRSAEQLRSLVVHLQNARNLDAVYVDLAGGLDARALRLQHLLEPVEHDLVRVAAGAANTSCAYLVAGRTVHRLAELSILSPEVARLPIDWLVNLAFLREDQLPDRERSTCLHARPPALDHGSFTGAVRSSVR